MPSSPVVSTEPYTAFLDESGDHSLDKIDPQYPFFGLAAILMLTADHKPFARDLSAWKTAFFGKDVCLHMREINRNLGEFIILQNSSIRQRFRKELRAKMDQHEWTALCSVILKQKHLDKYGLIAENPYFLTLEFLLERVYFEMRERRSRAGFVAESRAPDLDLALSVEFDRLMTNGTRYVTAYDLRQRVNRSLLFQSKAPEAIGLQVADLVIGPVCRYVGEKPPQEIVAVGTHIRRSPDGTQVLGYGLKVFP